MATFEQFYKETYRYVYVFFSSRIANKSAIDDLCQETYIRFYQKYGENLSEESIKIIIGFARNIYKEFVYKQVKSRSMEYNDEFHYENLLGETHTSSSKQKKQFQLILKFLPKLNERVRKVIEYRFLFGMKRKEVADLVNLKERDVLKYQQRGIKYLKKYLEKEDLL